MGCTKLSMNVIRFSRTSYFSMDTDGRGIDLYVRGDTNVEIFRTNNTLAHSSIDHDNNVINHSTTIPTRLLA